MSLSDEDRPDNTLELKPCFACPDGNEWSSNGPTGRACKTCCGYAILTRDGSKLTKEEYARARC